MSALFLEAGFVRAEIDKLKAEYPELEDDETLRADAIEGETDAFKIIERALDERQEAETMAGAIKAREEDLSARRTRFERKADAMKSLIRSIMQAANLPKLTLAEATLSITKPRTTVVVENEADLPQGYFKIVKQADKAAIKSALERGDEIPGAVLATGSPGLMVRTK